MTEGQLKNSKDLMEINQVLLTDFLKHIVMVSGAVLSIFVSFREHNTDNNLLFLLTACLLLCTILIGTATLYLQIIQIRKLRRDYAAKVKSDNLMPYKKKGVSGVFSKHNMFALFLELVTVLSFFASMVFLVCYAIF